MSITRHHDGVRVVFYPHAGGGTRLSAPVVAAGRDEPPCPVVSASFDKAMDQGFSGTAQISLRWTPGLESRYRGQTWLDLVKPGDWFLLDAVQSGYQHVVTVGIVGTITERFMVADGAPFSVYAVSARDLGCTLDDTEIWFNEVGRAGLAAGAAMFGLLNKEAGTPHELCAALAKGFLDPEQTALYGGVTAGGGVWRVPESARTLFQILVHNPSVVNVIDFDSHMGRTRGLANILQQLFGTTYNLGSLLRDWGHTALNEVFYDLRSADPRGTKLTPALVVRERPFPVFGETLGAWDRLPVARVPRSALLTGSSLSLSGAERYNAFVLIAASDALNATGQTLYNPPLFMPDSVARYGLRKMEVTSRFAAVASVDGYSQELGRWLWLLASWYSANASMLSGSLSLRGFFPALRIGRRLRLGGLPDGSPTEQVDAYVESVGVRWAPIVGWTADVGVTRGLRGTTSWQGLLAESWKDVQYLVEHQLRAVKTDPFLPPPDFVPYSDNVDTSLGGGLL